MSGSSAALPLPTITSIPCAVIMAAASTFDSMTGATVGAAYVIGFIEALLILWIGLYWTPAVLFGVMIMVRLGRPTGLFGKR